MFQICMSSLTSLAPSPLGEGGGRLLVRGEAVS